MRNRSMERKHGSPKQPLLEGENDPAKQDGKVMALSGNSVYLYFFFSVVLGIPLVILLLPFVLLTVLLKKVYKATCKPRPRAPTKVDLAPPSADQVRAPADRSYDIVLMGATGFTGRLAAKYLAAQYGASSASSPVKWAIAGRKQSKLEEVRAELAATDAALANLPIILADSFDADSLRALCNDTRCVVSTVGPFARYGTGLVQCCTQFGTHYCDITGESDWMREMIDRFDDQARVTGAQIVHMCGHDAVPWDIVIQQLHKHMQAQGEELVSVKMLDEIGSSPSGGTIETIFHSLEDRVRYRAQCGFDPLLKTMSGAKSDCRSRITPQNTLGRSREHGGWVVPFFMSSVMFNCVRRSNAILKYSTNFSYYEAKAVAGFMAGFYETVEMLLFGMSLSLPPLAWFARKFVLPSPGEGPSVATMDAGYLKITAYGKGSEGGKAKAIIYFPTDPGYRDTARMLVESGLSLSLEGDRIPVGGGVWTPASCMADVLLERLCNTGTKFCIE